MLLLLSPSKTLVEHPERKSGKESQPQLISETKKLVPVLKKHSQKDIAKLMGLSEKLAKLNYERYQHFTFPFSAKNAAQCIFMFKGDVYEGLDADSLNDKEIAFANDQIRILSGLYGLLRPLDLMQPYRLEMGTKLKNPLAPDLYGFWGDKITKTINQELSAHKHPVLLNLASGEYYKAVQAKNIQGRVIDITFKEKKGKDFKVIGIHAKRARGLMARFITQQRLEAPDGLMAFDAEGYCYNGELSSPKELVFTR